jgi:hypothetical protein
VLADQGAAPRSRGDGRRRTAAEALLEQLQRSALERGLSSSPLNDRVVRGTASTMKQSAR